MLVKNHSKTTQTLAISLKSDLGFLWRDLMRYYTSAWLRRTLTGKSDFRLLAERVAKFEALIDAIIIKDCSAGVFKVLRATIEESYSENLLEDQFRAYLEALEITSPEGVTVTANSTSPMPSVKFLTREFGLECLSEGFWGMIEDQDHDADHQP